MQARRFAVLAVMLVCLAGVVLAQDDEMPLSNWGAAPYWTPQVPRAQSELGAGMVAQVQGMQAQAEALPSSPLPFVAIAPCRIVDTRVPVSDGFHQPNFANDESRTFPFPSSPDCTGIPEKAAAYSINIQFRPISQLSFLTAYPTGTTMPLVSTMTAGPAAWVQNAAIVPAGTSAAIDIYCQYAGRVVIDINGYYGPQSVVTSLKRGASTLTGDVTLAEGANVTITPSGDTLTIAATGGPGGELPVGSTSQTLRSNGSAWEVSSALTNDGSHVGVSGQLRFPATTATSGQITMDGVSFLHGYGATTNAFVGRYAGNFTMTGGWNTGLGYASLYHNDAGAENAGSGYRSLYYNTAGSLNTATGSRSLSTNTTGSDNTATGYNSLAANTTAGKNTAVGSGSLQTQSYDNGGSMWDSLNTAIGYQALYSSQPDSEFNGYQNTAVGAESLHSNTTGYRNTAGGYRSLVANTTGHHNTASGGSSLDGNTTGVYNSAIGYYAGSGNGGGSYNTFVGAYAGPASSSFVNATAIGYVAMVNASYKVRIGNEDVQVIEGQVDWSFPSDIRHKKDVRDLALGLDLILHLRPVEYRLKTGNDRLDLGFIAQEIESLLGDGYNIIGVGEDEARTLSLRRGELIAPLVKAVQEQQVQIQNKDLRIAALESQQATQQADIDALKSALAERDRALERRLATLEQARR